MEETFPDNRQAPKQLNLLIFTMQRFSCEHTEVRHRAALTSTRLRVARLSTIFGEHCWNLEILGGLAEDTTVHSIRPALFRNNS